jgi:hypothetical protein
MPKSDSTFDPRGYATVADRISLFYEQFPSGRINTELVSRDDGEITFKALVYRQEAELAPAATGWASERLGDGDVNSVACLENTETSAVGRALANLGFTASTKRPSREEMEKAERARQRLSLAMRAPSGTPNLQDQADGAHEVLKLLAVAGRRGFSERRLAIMTAHLTRTPALPLRKMRRLETRVRGWLRRRGM